MEVMHADAPNADFSTLFAFIKPKAEEVRWREIPWEADLWAGRLKAAAVGKPMFIWAMNGDPQGCV